MIRSTAVTAETTIETHALSDSGQLVRRVTLSDGTVVESPMGTAAPRRGETLDQWAERAFLVSSVRPSTVGGGRPVRVVDVYAGCGGFSLGLAEACRATGRRFSPVAAVDVDLDALGVYAENLAPRRPVRDDVTDLIDGRFRGRLTSRERWLRREIGPIDFLLAGPPCQGFSALNNHTRGDDPKNGLYGHVARIAEVFEPRHVLIENVSSVRSYSPTAVLRATDRLAGIGYEVDEGVVPGSELGIPQLRRRHLVVGTSGTVPNVAEVVRAFRRSPRGLRWAIGDLAGIRVTDEFDRPTAPTEDNKKRMRFLREHRRWDLPDYLRPACHRDFDHTYKSMYGRLRWDQPAQTITSGYGSMGQGRYVHPNGWRTLTPHEAARIQVFPDWFRFGLRSRTAWATLIGNAVPMKLSYVFGVWLLR
jgi:DNA (cytosine-5)-methyltransferase 1